MNFSESQNEPERAARILAQKERATAHYRAGHHRAAKHLIRETIAMLSADETEMMVTLVNNLAIFERATKNHAEALRLQLEIRPAVDLCSDPLTIANFHNGLALTFKMIAKVEGVRSYYDRALIEFEAARYFYEQAAHHRFTGGVDNNIAGILIELERFGEADAYLTRAHAAFAARHGDADRAARLAEIDDTRARLLLKQLQFSNARRFANRSIEALARANESALLARSLETLREIVETELRELRGEVADARAHNKPVRWLEPQPGYIFDEVREGSR